MATEKNHEEEGKRRNAMIEGHRGVKTASPSHFLPPLPQHETFQQRKREKERGRRRIAPSRKVGGQGVKGGERRRRTIKTDRFRERERETEGQVPGGVRQKSEEKTEGWREKEA